ncbi:MAG: hypothetical protein EOP50_20385 [Sphingobacteriales bacterium]|nr:MAG: hypothetical protein EOP50_20385 [Sphingobacteriales bacterium]
MFFGLLCGQAAADETAISRTQAALIAQQKFGGRVISVDEIELPPALAEGEDASSDQVGTRFIVKLMQKGRVQVINLDAQGAPLDTAP